MTQADGRCRLRGVVAAVAVICIGLGALWAGSDGFRAITAEQARRLDVERAPRALPPLALEDQDGQIFRFGDYRGKILVVNFFYSRCVDVCPILNEAMAEIRDTLAARPAAGDFRLLSISFDPWFDTIAALSSYARVFDADGTGWRVARIRNQAQLGVLLESFGIVAIPDGRGGFEHNGAIHVVGRDGRLRAIHDYDAPRFLAQKIWRMP
jgi:protein SCO1/2